MQYRREIDGLRAVAVIPVILFHAGFRIFSGGFVGVDVFFVISGYLITNIIINQLEQGKFSILQFYERRARRILPALFFVMLCCIPFAWMWLLPQQFKNFSESLVAVSLFASNILFWSESGYFGAASEEKPLLHTWSLAVEEQYYLLFPVFLILLWRFGRNRVFYSIVVVTIISLLFSEWGWRNNPSANFYLAHTRAWELLAGSICAFFQFGRKQKSNNILAALGLGLILFAIFYYNKNTPFPSLYTLAPVVGTALIIMFGAKNTWTARLISTRIFVGVGLISYSSYLWHQPLFAFARIHSIYEPERWLMLLLAGVSLMLAYLSWRYIEQPFRTKPLPIFPTKRAIFSISAITGIAFITFGIYGHLNNGSFNRKTSLGISYSDIGQKILSNHGLHPDCEDIFTLSKNCRTGDKPEFLLWGDSYAMHLAQGIIGDKGNIKLIQHTKSTCSPIVGISLTNHNYGASFANSCIRFNNKVYKWLQQNNSVQYVVLSSPFKIVNSKILTQNGDLINNDQFDYVIEQLQKTVNLIRKSGKKPIVVSPPPNNGKEIGKCLASTAIFESKNKCNFLITEYSKETLTAYKLMEKISKFVPVLMLDKFICNKKTCNTSINNIFIYRDGGHLSKEGSRYIGVQNNLAKLIRKLANNF